MSLSVRTMFDRVDTDGSSSLDQREVKTFCDSAVGGGLLGGVIAGKVASKFLDTFDPTGTGAITWAQFAKNAIALLPSDVKSDPAKAIAQAQALFAEADVHGNGEIGHDELRAAIKKRLPGGMFSGKGTKATAAANLVMHLAGKADGATVSRAEADSLIADLRRHTLATVVV